MLYHWVTEAMMSMAHYKVLHLYISIYILLSIYISQGADKENLINNQELL